MGYGKLRGLCLFFGALWLIVPLHPASAAAPSEEQMLRRIMREVNELKADKQQDEEKIQDLEQRVGAIQNQNHQLKEANQKLQTDTTAKIATLQTKVDAPPSPEEFGGAFDRYLGTHTFTVTGAAGGQFVYNQQNAALNNLHHDSQNSFFVDWEPMILYRPTDWILFQGVISTGFGSTGTGVDLSTADFQILANKYLTVVAGLFDQPFGDWYETQSPMWVNRFVTAPLPFGVESVVPPGEIGVQLRGGMQFGALGQDFDYTVWGGNGPNYSSTVLGAAVSSPTSVASSQSSGKSIGARFRVYPLPLEKEWGRLELGASTYNGEWNNRDWLTSWGVDFNYFIDNLQTRGEWLEAYRQMPNGQTSDNRQGWYVQAGYFLGGLNVPYIPDQLNGYLQRLEPLVRYSGVNQRGVSTDDLAAATGIGLGGTQVGLVPDFGINGSPATYAPHAREVALGLDYWFAPSIVWQNEFDIELPRAGGVFVSPTGVETPAGATPNDRAFLSQFTVGF
ncbi:MAG: hypothetical protein IVW54_05540 [Candidatus Binataceae bacterium]|nr:hypothetical protein [Candidatus Binataceae bacterium]